MSGCPTPMVSVDLKPVLKKYRGSNMPESLEPAGEEASVCIELVGGLDSYNAGRFKRLADLGGRVIQEIVA